VCCQVEVSATNWSLVQGSTTDCGVSQICVTMKPQRNEEAQTHISCRAIGNKKLKSNAPFLLYLVLCFRDILENICDAVEVGRLHRSCGCAKLASACKCGVRLFTLNSPGSWLCGCPPRLQHISCCLKVQHSLER
jgi:hypothetical protein